VILSLVQIFGNVSLYPIWGKNWPLTLTSYSTTRTTRRLVSAVARQVSRLVQCNRLHPLTSIPSIDMIRSPALIVLSLNKTAKKSHKTR